ncbi:unnamed protein product, partial [Owenia fusiformis]
RNELKKRNATVDADVLFTFDEGSPDVIWEPLKDIRVFVSFTPGTLTFGKLLCKLHNLGFYGRQYVLLTYFFARISDWDSIDESVYGCNKKEMLQVLDGALGCSQMVTTLVGMYDNDKHFSTKQTYNDLKPLVKLIPTAGLRYYQPIVYDSVWAIAMAINATIRQEHDIDEIKNYKHRNSKNKTLLESLYGNLLDVEFEGLSGKYYYEKSTGVRQFDSYIGLFDSNGRLTYIGYFDKQNSNIVTKPDDVVWKSKGGAAPLDEEIKQYERKRISKTTIIVLSVFAGFGILLALIYVLYAIVHRNHIMIKDEWRIMTYVIVFGCIILDTYVLIHIADLQT